jgi:hypothetical protein
MLGQGYRRNAAVEERHAEVPFQAGDGARHSRLHDVGLAGGRGKAARLATRKEILKVTQVHSVMLWPIIGIDCRHRKQPLDKLSTPARWLMTACTFIGKAVTSNAFFGPER